jgi:uncharacterized membrane protein
MSRLTRLPDVPFIRAARVLSTFVLIIAYAALVHHVNASGQISALGATLAVLPLLAIGLALARNPKSRLAGFAMLAMIGLLAWQQWPQIERHASLIYWLQDVGLMLFLLLTFGHTLRAGHKPLCVQFAEMIHGPVSAAHAHYARQVTVAWTLFFGVMATASSLLYFLAPLATWSVFVNFLTLPLVALMFIAEFLLRRRVLRDLPDGSPFDALRAYLDKSARAH